MSDPFETGWGLWSYVPETAKVAWGFRAIDEGGSFSLLGSACAAGLHDRQTMRGPDACKKALAHVLNKGLLEQFRDTVKELKASGQLRGSEQQEFEIFDPKNCWGGAVHCIVNTNGSYGYIYGIFWFDDVANLSEGTWSGPGPICEIGDRVVTILGTDGTVVGRYITGRCLPDYPGAAVLIVAESNIENARKAFNDPEHDGLTVVFGCDLVVPEPAGD